jgi:hypothetical protein
MQLINKYVMIENNKVVQITNISGTTYTDINNNKYNEEKVQYIWEKRIPVKNPKYIALHLLETGEEKENS